jgi:hypothetical protein
MVNPPPQPSYSGPPQLSPNDRRARLAQAVAAAVATQNARVENQGEYQAVLVTGQKVNHTLHFLISVFTCGLWLIVWLILGLTGGEKRHIVQVDEWGNVRTQHV